MNQRTIAAFLAALAVLVVLASPVVAKAAPRSRSVSAEVQMRGTHGFEIRLSVSSRSTSLLASKGIVKLGEEGVTYSSRRGAAPVAGFDGDKLNLRLGHLGRFRARFVPTTTKTRGGDADGCGGEPTTVERGFFVGSLDFLGERGYTSVNARRAPGTVMKTGAAPCVTRSAAVASGDESARAKEAKELEEDEFRLVAGDKKGDTILRASREEVSRGSTVTPTSFMVSVVDQKGELTVTHSAFVLNFHFDPGADFQTPNLAEPLAEARLQPPAPFTGSADFSLEGPETASWTGDLAVELPGLGRVPLAGYGLEAGLCKGRSTCTRTLPPRLASALAREAGFGARSGTISIGGSGALGVAKARRGR